jgi:pimeloyl-ACP methyl ester carboxylesterase
MRLVLSYETLFGAAVAEARRRELPVFDASPPTNRHLDVGGLKLHYLDWGGNASTPMLLIHGAMVTAHVWDFFGLEMRQHFHVYAVNLRGHGDSGWAPDADYSRSRMTADVVQLIRHLDLRNMVLIGHSLGGSIAALVAAEVPERIRTLTLIDSTLLPNPRPNAMAAFVNGPDSFPSIEAFAEHAATFNPRRRADQLTLSLRWNARQRDDGQWTWKYDPALRQRRAPEFERVWAALEGLNCPTLFVRAGENSHVTDDALERLRTLHHIALVTVPDAAHNVMGDNPGAFSSAVRDFLSANGLLPSTYQPDERQP